MRAWWALAVVVLTVVAAAAGVRALEWPVWYDSSYWFGDSPLIPSADVYAWLAGAVEAGRMSGWPMSRLIGWLAEFSAQPPGVVAFWLPCLLAGIPGAAIAALCWVRGAPIAGLTAGIFASCSLGYLARTRLGYAETELFAMSGATVFAVVWALFLEQLAGSDPGAGKAPGIHWLMAGLTVAWAGQTLYPSAYPVLIAVAVSGLVYGAMVGGRKTAVSLGVATTGLLWALHFGLVGLVGALLLIGILRYRPAYLKWGVMVLLAAATVVVVAALEREFLFQTVYRVSAYVGWGLKPAPMGDWILPRVDESIQETVPVTLAEWIRRVGTHWSFLLVGLAGYGLAVWRWPELVTFLPLLGLGLASYWLGHRFAMYAAPVVGLGLGMGLALLTDKLNLKPVAGSAAQFGLTVVIGVTIVWHAQEMRPDPTLGEGHARALAAVGEVNHDRGRVWTWWDTGYAAQFYTRLPTLADGGSAARQRIFMLGQVFGARSSTRAAALIRFGAEERSQAMDGEADWREVSFATRPLETLTGLPALEVEQFLDGLETRPPDRHLHLPDEFVVFSWKTLMQAQWIDYFGRWRLTEGFQGYGQIARIRPPVELDEARGLLDTAEGVVALKSLDIMDESSHYRNKWPREDGAHAVINHSSGEGVLLDTSLYQMMAVQMLIGDPQNFQEDFELVSDQSPAARVYRLR